MNSVDKRVGQRRFGIVGGVGALAGADVLFKLVQRAARQGEAQPDVLLEQQPLSEGDAVARGEADPRESKFYVFNIVRHFESQGVDRVLLPSFICHTFLDDIQAETALPIVNLMTAVTDHLERELPAGTPLGVLTCDYVRRAGLLESHLGARHPLHYPSADAQAGLMEAIYGPRGLKAGYLDDAALDAVMQACRSLQADGVGVILAASTEVALLAERLAARGIRLIDSNRVYADHALERDAVPAGEPVKVGIVGGVGPAATVDFMDKLVRLTRAQRDQEHVRLLVEHNPQIPDRTAHILGRGPDPSIALYAACKRLEAGGAAMIAIPCNTAHAYLGDLQPHLSIPVISMPDVTMARIAERYPHCPPVGLLATSGTMSSGVYRRAAERAGLTLIVPDDAHQAQVMNAIYGGKGVKAGFVDGECRADLLAAARHLADRGAEVLILGCTELPLIVPGEDVLNLGGREVGLVDPTRELARRCVELAQGA